MDKAQSPDKSDERKAFEAWLLDVMGLDAPAWDADRNCYSEFIAHLAWKAWSAPRSHVAAPMDSLEQHSMMLELCHQLGASDGENMIEMLFAAVKDARRYRWLRDKATFAAVGAAQVQGEALDHACDRGLKANNSDRAAPRSSIGEPYAIEGDLKVPLAVPDDVKKRLAKVMKVELDKNWQSDDDVIDSFSRIAAHAYVIGMNRTPVSATATRTPVKFDAAKFYAEFRSGQWGEGWQRDETTSHEHIESLEATVSAALNLYGKEHG